jgi:uncharacterized protein YdhG (YjbR/CyaY superfamily)
MAAQRRAYLAGLNPKARAAVEALLAAIRAAAPEAEPVFSYRIPGFRLHDRAFLWSAGFAKHVSLYPITARIRAANAEALSGYKTSTGTVQFPLDRPLPLALAKRLIKARIAEMTADVRASKARPRRASQ